MSKGKTTTLPDPTGLTRFLKAERNSITREVLLRHKFIFDVLLAAARRDYALQIFLGEVDREGFDIVLDDTDAIRKIQLKSVFREVQDLERAEEPTATRASASRETLDSRCRSDEHRHRRSGRAPGCCGRGSHYRRFVRGRGWSP